MTFVYVAETQEQAEQEYIPHLQLFFEDYTRTVPQYLAPPGYLSIEQLKMRAALADKLHGGFDFNAISTAFFIAVGTPDKVANQIGEWSETMNTTHINSVMHFADMPHWKTVKNLTLFAEEVIPRLRSRVGSPRRGRGRVGRRRRASMGKFTRDVHTVDGVKTAVYTAGKGEPLVFFHGAGTIDGFDFAEPWTEKYQVIVPHHPGFGESGDDPTFTDLHDYVMHYLELFDVLKLDAFNLVGLSLGGYLAAKFASEHGHRVKKLALIAPAGMIDPEHPMLDILMVPGEQVPGLLVSNFDVLKKRLPEKPDLDFMARPVPRGDDGDAPAVGASRGSEVHALSASRDDADADRLGRRGQDHSRPAGGDLAEARPQRGGQGVQGRGAPRAPREAGSRRGGGEVPELSALQRWRRSGGSDDGSTHIRQGRRRARRRRGPAAAEPRPGGARASIRIGYAISLSGPFAPGAQSTSWSQYKLWAKDVNDAGGITLKKYGNARCPIELIDYDDRSQPDELIKLVERLILNDKVDLVLGPWGTHMNLAVAPIINKYEYPVIFFTAAAHAAPRAGAALAVRVLVRWSSPVDATAPLATHDRRPQEAGQDQGPGGGDPRGRAARRRAAHRVPRGLQEERASRSCTARAIRWASRTCSR